MFARFWFSSSLTPQASSLIFMANKETLKDPSLQKLPPHNLEAELFVLGAIFLDNTALTKAIDILKVPDFFQPAHRKIYAVMLRLFDKNEVIDLVTVQHELQREGLLEEIGGAAYLMNLMGIVPTAANVTSHARIVKEKSLIRRLIQISTQITTESYEDQEDADYLMEKAQKLLFDIFEERVRPGFFPIRPLIKDSYNILEEIYEKKRTLTGIQCGFRSLDKELSGLHKGDLIIIAGRPSMGKTAFALNIAAKIGLGVGDQKNIPVAIFSLETTKEQLVMRLICSEASVDSHQVKNAYINKEEWVNLVRACGRLNEAPIWIDDTPAISTLELRAKARRLKHEQDIGLVVVDYLQLMQGESRESRQQEVSGISRSLKSLALELDIPVIALSQLSRAVEQRGGDHRPMLADLRESGAIEQDADVVLFIHRPEKYKKKEDVTDEERGLAEIMISKQRNGPAGIDVKLGFLDYCTKFVERVNEPYGSEIEHKI